LAANEISQVERLKVKMASLVCSELVSFARIYVFRFTRFVLKKEQLLQLLLNSDYQITLYFFMKPDGTVLKDPAVANHSGMNLQSFSAW